MPLESLLLSRDPEIIRVLQPALEKLSIDVEVCRGVGSGNEITFAILNGSTTTQQAFQMGANFVLQKPVSALNAMRCFSAAVNFMLRERRRYFRHPMEESATLTFSEGQKLKVSLTNLSEGGMAIFFRGPLPKGVSSVSFKLPGSASALDTKVQIAWIDDSGRAGLRFIEMPKESRTRLDAWLAEQCEKMDRQAH
jgi:c-di-GMP-binding flagellar brake protein YcgR